MKQNELSKHFDVYSKIENKDERDKYYNEVILPILNNEDASQFTDTLVSLKLEAKSLKENLLFQESIEGINLAYIAEHYFGKSKSWLYHRVKGNIVNGKPAQFKDDELIKFREALQDMSKKLQELSISLI